MQNHSSVQSFHIIVLDHHHENDQRIIRHIDFCKKNQIPVERIRFNLHHRNPEMKINKIKDNNSLHSPIIFKGGIFNYILVYLSMIFSPWIWYSLIKIIQKIVQKKGDQFIFHIHDPFLLIFGSILKIFKYNSSYIVYDRHEYYEEMRGIGKYCETFARNFIDGIVLVTDNQIQSTKIQIPDINHIVVVPNYPNIDNQYADRIQEKISTILHSDRIHFIYIGSLSTKVDRDIYGMMDICSALLKKFQEVYVTIGGSTSEKDLLERFDILTKMYPGRFFYTGYLNRNEVIQFTCDAHFGFFLIDVNSPYWVSCSPNKIFDYLLYGVVPIIRANIEEKENLKKCSLLYDQTDSMEKIIQDVVNFIENRQLIQTFMKESKKLSQLYSFESVEERYSLLYQLVISSNKEK
jgi:ATP:corrinoid adenosyltransferase